MRLDFRVKGNPGEIGPAIVDLVKMQRIKANKPSITFLGGDSVTGDARLYFKENENIRFDTVREAVGSFNAGNAIEVQTIKEKNIQSSIDWCKVKGAFSHGVKPVFEITFTNGKRIKITEEHSLFTLYGKEQLKAATIRQNNHFITIEEFDKPEVDTDYTEDDMQFFGIWLGDGWFESGKTIRIATGNDISMLAFLERYVKKRGLKLKWKKKGDRRIHSVEFMKEMQSLGFIVGSENKRIPNWVFLLPKNKIAAFIKGYLMADGSIHTAGTAKWEGKKYKKVGITFASVSRKLLEDTQLLLNIFGIQSDISEPYWGSGFPSKNGQYKLTVQKVQSQKKFITRIGLPEGKRPLKVFEILERLIGCNDRPLSLRKVRKIIPKGFDEVFDFTVSPSESFIANGILLHNSGEGKSMAALRFQEKSTLNELEKDPELFLTRQVIYTPFEYSKKVRWILFDKEAKRHRALIMMEGRELVKAKMWFSMINQAIGDINAMSRAAKALDFTLISQSISDIDKDVRRTLNFYGWCWRPWKEHTRVYFYRIFKDIWLENPKLHQRSLHGTVNGERTHVKYFYMDNLRKDIAKRFEEIDFIAKKEIILKKLNAIDEMLAAEKPRLDRIERLAESAIKNPTVLAWMLQRSKMGTIRLKKEFMEVENISIQERKDLEKLIKGKLISQGMMAVAEPKEEPQGSEPPSLTTQEGREDRKQKFDEADINAEQA